MTKTKKNHQDTKVKKEMKPVFHKQMVKMSALNKLVQQNMPFYERYTKLDECEKLLQKGEALKGRIFFDTKGNIEDYDHSYAFVKVEGVNMPIKVRGLQYLNRAYDLDEVYIKLCNWI